MHFFTLQLVKVTHPDIKQPSKPVDTYQLGSHAQVQPLSHQASEYKTKEHSKSGEHSEGGASTDDNQSTSSSTLSRNRVAIKLPPELDTHNYAKSPILECTGEGDDSDDCASVGCDLNVDVDSDHEAEPQFHVSNMGQTGSLEITKPLTVQTRFSRPPSPGESTDTASNASSAFNSPVRSRCPSTQTSPRGQHRATNETEEDAQQRAREIDKLVVIKMSNSSCSGQQTDTASSARPTENEKQKQPPETSSVTEGKQDLTEQQPHKHHAFAPKVSS